MADHTRRLRLSTLLLLLLVYDADSGWLFPPVLSVTPMDLDLLRATVDLINPTATYNLMLVQEDAMMPQAHPSSTMDALNAINSGGMMHYNIGNGGTLYVDHPTLRRCDPCPSSLSIGLSLPSRVRPPRVG
jgi:hypothetical protein